MVVKAIVRVLFLCALTGGLQSLEFADDGELVEEVSSKEILAYLVGDVECRCCSCQRAQEVHACISLVFSTPKQLQDAAGKWW